jgi:hypothetical protein
MVPQLPDTLAAQVAPLVLDIFTDPDDGGIPRLLRAAHQLQTWAATENAQHDLVLFLSAEARP